MFYGLNNKRRDRRDDVKVLPEDVSPITRRQWPSAQSLRSWLIGAGLLLGSILIGVVGVIGLIVGLFFELANYEQLVRPALITGGVSLLVAIVVMLEGIRNLPPRLKRRAGELSE